MEVGDEPVEYLELEARVDEYVGEAVAGADASVRGNALESPARGRADGYHAFAGFFGGLYQLGGLFGYLIMLRVHLVLGHVVDLNGAEGAQSHVEGDVADVHALCADPVHQLVGEVQSGGRGGGRAELVRVDRLVTLLIL